MLLCENFYLRYQSSQLSTSLNSMNPEEEEFREADCKIRQCNPENTVIKEVENDSLRLFTFSTPSHQERRISIYENAAYFSGHGSIIWGASLAFCELIFNNPELFADKAVLEVGSGCGMTGIAASMIGGQVTLSDMTEYISNLKRNAALNDADVSIVEINWFNEHTPTQQYDVILGCEVVYMLSLVTPLVMTMDAYLKPGGEIYMISSADRSGFLMLFHLLQKKGYTLTTHDVPVPDVDSIVMNPPEELSVSWFCDPQFQGDTKHLVLLKCKKPLSSDVQK